MDGAPLAYDELFELTRRQAGMIERLRAEIERRSRKRRQVKAFCSPLVASQPGQPVVRATQILQNEAVNWQLGRLAERELRPAVIAHKLSAGNRTDDGAETHAVLVSILRTCRRRGLDILQRSAEMLRRGPSHVIDLLDDSSPVPTR